MTDSPIISIVPSKKGAETALVNINGRDFYIHSSYDPIAEAKRWAAGVDLQKSTVYVVYGLGLGYHIDELFRLTDDSSKIIVIEPLKEFIDIFYKRTSIDRTDLGIKVIVQYMASKSEMYDFLFSVIPQDSFENVSFSVFGQSSNLFREEYGDFIEAFKECINAKSINRNTSLYFAEQWQKNVIENLPGVIDSVPFKGLIDMFKGKPGIIISAGPSLDKNIELLKEAKDRAVLVAVGTSVKALLKHDIQPDFVLSIDGGEPNYRHFKDVSIDCPLVYDLYLHPKIVEEYKGPKIISFSTCPHTLWIAESLGQDFGLINAGPTVANMAFDFIRQLGCDPIVFVGQDLAYTDSKTHANGTTYEGQRVENTDGKNYIYLDDVYGNKVLSSKVFLSFKTWFEDQIYQHPGRTYIDATEGGARIKGTEIMTLRDVIDKYCIDNINVKEIINKYIHGFAGYKKDDIDKLAGSLHNVQKQIEKLQKLCKRGEKFSKRLLDVYQKDIGYDTNKLLKDLDEIDGEIKEYQDGLGFISIMLQLVSFKVLKGFEPKENETEKEKGIRISNMSYALYYGILATINEIQPLFKKCISDIETRYAEEGEPI